MSSPANPPRDPKEGRPPLSDDAALRAIVEGVESETGDRFFFSLVKHLAAALDCEYSFVSELSPDRSTFRTRAVWGRGAFLENFEVPVDGTPCEAVLKGSISHHPERVCQLYPNDVGIQGWRAESYCGVPLLDRSGVAVGHLAIFSDKPMYDGPRGIAIMRIFAARALAEVERLQSENNLRMSEERLGRILASAMDAIITFDVHRRIVLFNESAEKIFRCSAASVIGGLLDSFLTDALRGLIDRIITPLDQSSQRTFVGVPDGMSARRHDGEEFPIEATISEVETRSGKLFTLILRDIEERLRGEAEVRQLSLQKEYLLEEIKEEHNFEQIVGQTASLADVIEKVRLVADTDASVLILGETGTGKELIARAVHSNSPRKDHPLVRVNCAALPAGLIESELFGHEKGAFTGASERRIGRFELAHRGTIFLDEIGEVPLDIQVKLLRVLQEREFERVGGREPIKVNVRVIAATNRDIPRAIGEGTFRQDLYYRLNVFPLNLPPLRARKEDIPLLVQFFVRRFAAKIGRHITRVPSDTMNQLVMYPWPGNVRELENVIERAVILSRGNDLEIAAEALHVPSHPEPTLLNARRVSTAARPPAADPGSLDAVEREHILEMLRRTNWKVEGENGAARLLNINPSTLRSRMKKLGIQRSVEGLS